MVARDFPLPARIEPDAVLEAIVEIRFDAPTILPEVLFGRLSEHAAWAEFQQRRLAAYEIPAALRESDVNLRFAPIFELVRPDSRRIVRIGPHAMSYHVLAPYPGWGVFRPEIEQAIDELYSKASGMTVTRIGMRYINALSADKHGVDTPGTLDLSIRVSQRQLHENLNLNFTVAPTTSTRCTIRISTKEFVQGIQGDEPRVFVDADVFTPEVFELADSTAVKQWIVEAHDVERKEFFCLLTEQTLTRLRKD